MPEETVARPTAELHLCDKLRLDPADPASGNPWQLQREGRCRPSERFQLAPQTLSRPGGKAAPDPSHMDEISAFINAHDERADGLSGGRRGHVSRNDEFLAVRALRLEPVRSAAADVGPVLALRHDALEAETARVAEYRFAIAFQMCAEPYDGICWRIVEKSGQERLALEQRHLREIVAVEVEKIEREENHPFGAAGLKVGLERSEARHPGLVLDDDLAVQER